LKEGIAGPSLESAKKEATAAKLQSLAKGKAKEPETKAKPGERIKALAY